MKGTSENNLSYAPQDIFNHILKFAVIPTFDIIINIKDLGVIIVKRKIAPYKNFWALPGLRMMKNEIIENTLKRIGKEELGIKIDPTIKHFIGQYVGRFKTENNRQDLSTCYAINCELLRLNINSAHFSGHRFIESKNQIPNNTGAMYRYYLNMYFNNNSIT